MDPTLWALLIALASPNASSPQPSSQLVQVATFATRAMCEDAAGSVSARGFSPSRPDPVDVNYVAICVPVKY